MQMVGMQKEESNRSHSFSERMLCAYMSGGKAARNLNDNQHQTFAKAHSFSFEASTKGQDGVAQRLRWRPEHRWPEGDSHALDGRLLPGGGVGALYEAHRYGVRVGERGRPRA